MIFFKRLLTIIPLFATGSMLARTSAVKTSVASKKIPTRQKQTIISRSQSQSPKQQTEIQRQRPDETSVRYTEILASLKQKNPDSSDISTLRNIKTEIERQINVIEQPFLNKNSITHMKPYLEQQVAENVNAIENELFPVRENQQEFPAIKSIVRNFTLQYPATERITTINLIYNAITENRTISMKYATSPQTRQVIRAHITNIVEGRL